MKKTLSLAKPALAVAAAAALSLSLVALAGCSGGTDAATNAASSGSSSSSAAEASDADLMSGTHHAIIQVEGYDPITVELDADAAPVTVTNFANLADDGYYNGLSFYRIVDDFCLQGGTTGNTASGNDPLLQPIKGEFSSNGVDNPQADKFDRGRVAMAGTSAPDSANTTFFFTLGDNDAVGTALDGKYAAFGTINEEGMAIIDAIVADYLANVDDPQMGAISDQAKQAKIVSIQMVD